ncbi:MAG: cysteine desulfurase [Ruminococcaceae bacterium]|nr:cysteine desulfurase [Oscillospiraceae bacterium]
MDIIYLDNSATTSICPEAIDAMKSAFECYANPSSLHFFGHNAEKMISEARKNIASSLGIRNNSHSVIFTSGGTEANNIAVTGVALAKNYKKPRIILSNSEHACVMEPSKRLSESGFEVIHIPTSNGIFDFNAFTEAMNENTVLVSVMLVNNETGAIYDVKKVFDYARRINPSVVCHTDAVQGYLKVKFTLSSIGTDMITISSHKIHGPKGVGALVVKNELLKSKKIRPLVIGGGQELDLRSGTENTVGIAGFGAAAKVGFECFDRDFAYMNDCRNYLLDKLPDFVIVNNPEKHAPHIISITVPNIKSETMLHFLSSRGICVSSGSACSSHGKHGSYVLKAFGLDDSAADCTLRVSISHLTTKDQLDALCDALIEGNNTLIKIKR